MYTSVDRVVLGRGRCKAKAHIDSDHNPVVATVAVKLKKVLRAKNGVKWNIEKLKEKNSYTSLEFRTGVDLAVEKLIEHRAAGNPEAFPLCRGYM